MISGVFFKEKVKANQCKEAASSNEEILNEIKIELNSYLTGDVIDPTDDPYEWWRDNEKKYPNVCLLAKNKLFVPATSVPSERLFSKAGTIITDRRNRLKPSNAEKLIFLSNNLRALYFNNKK